MFFYVLLIKLIAVKLYGKFIKLIYIYVQYEVQNIRCLVNVLSLVEFIKYVTFKSNVLIIHQN